MLKHSASHICILLVRRVAPDSHPYTWANVLGMTSYLADSIPHIKEVPIQAVLQSPISKSLYSKAVRAPACRPASPSRRHILRKSQVTILPKERPVTREEEGSSGDAEGGKQQGWG
ncbi:UNVERIFIED_CONTAM: hypothetical protein Sradi_4406800 [Sesamum radiatum]|uniref:Uncharacterized protein n=1 Tax=Sesamum radiatum TaxID=300843 RepID=A0AAW2NQH2_SESRA